MDLLEVALFFGLLMSILPQVLLESLGFTTYGIRAGSFAAVIQSKLGDVRPDSYFAALQSTGVVGLSNRTMLYFGGIGFMCGIVFYCCYY